MKTYNFKPTIEFRCGMRRTNGYNTSDYPDSQIKIEPMLFSADLDYARKAGGKLTNSFIDRLDNNSDWIIDSRVHMLMKGWYPCIPGWHHDDVPRSAENGQPNYDSPEYLSEHVMMVIGGTSMTEFLKCPTILPKVEDGTVYKIWDEIIEKDYATDNILKVKSGDLWDFTWQDFHRGVMADKSSWRFFIRASRKTNRKFLNETRSQVQVYLPTINAGW